MNYQNEPEITAEKLLSDPVSNLDEPLMRQEDAARMLGLTPRALEAWRHKGDGPKFIRISHRCVRYRRSDLLKWIAERERISTSDPGDQTT